jgi:hypothetical protein
MEAQACAGLAVLTSSGPTPFGAAEAPPAVSSTVAPATAVTVATASRDAFMTLLLVLLLMLVLLARTSGNRRGTAGARPGLTSPCATARMSEMQSARFLSV